MGLMFCKTISSGLTSASLCQSNDVAVTIVFGWSFGAEVGIGSHFCYGFDTFFKAVCGICTFSVVHWCCFGVHGGIVGSGFAVVGSVGINVLGNEGLWRRTGITASWTGVGFS